MRQLAKGLHVWALESTALYPLPRLNVASLAMILYKGAEICETKRIDLQHKLLPETFTPNTADID